MKNNISLIAAHSLNQVIGVNNKLPWNLPSDLKKFRELTLNKPIVMGRKTLESIGRVLPKRRNIVLTRNQNFKFEGAEIFNNLEDVLNINNPENLEIMIIGGAEIYEIFLPYASKLYLTEVKIELEGDAFFPEFKNKLKNNWRLTHAEFFNKNINPDNQYDFEFKIYEKIKNPA